MDPLSCSMKFSTSELCARGVKCDRLTCHANVGLACGIWGAIALISKIAVFTCHDSDGNLGFRVVVVLVWSDASRLTQVTKLHPSASLRGTGAHMDGAENRGYTHFQQCRVDVLADLSRQAKRADGLPRAWTRAEQQQTIDCGSRQPDERWRLHASCSIRRGAKAGCS
jgi:hypothetical protein